MFPLDFPQPIFQQEPVPSRPPLKSPMKATVETILDYITKSHIP